MAPEPEPAASAVDATPRIFPTVGILLSRADLWSDWLSEAPQHQRADSLVAAFRCVVRLSSHTGWSEDEVLDRLGCDTKTEEELKNLSDAELRQSIAFMGWVETLVSELDVSSDKRLVVSGVARLLANADMDLDSCVEAMSSGEFTPMEYLRLGEIAQALQCAVRQLDNARGRRARQTQENNPFIDDSSPHISPRRLVILSRPDAQQLLGQRVCERMEEHFIFCPACGNANSQRLATESARRPTGVSVAA